MNTILAYPCGTKITLIYAPITCILTAIIIRFDKITYEASYFVGGDQYSISVHEQEFTTDENKSTIGYKP